MISDVNDAILTAIEDVVAEYEVSMAVGEENVAEATTCKSDYISTAEQDAQQIEEAPIKEDGPRARHLRQALRKVLNNTLKACR